MSIALPQLNHPDVRAKMEFIVVRVHRTGLRKRVVRGALWDYSCRVIMTQFFAFLFLLLMAIPALIAVSVGSRSLLGFLWNGMWFYIIGQTAQVAFDSPDAQSLGVVLAVLFIWRSLVFRRKTPFTFRAAQFPGGNFRFGNADAFTTQFSRGFPRQRAREDYHSQTRTSSQTETEYSSDSADMREVIEAEVITTSRDPRDPRKH